MKTPWLHKYELPSRGTVYTVDTRELDRVLTAGDHVEFEGTAYVVAQILTQKNVFGMEYPIIGVLVRPLTAEEL